jgi:hypothetical protein
MIGGIGIDPIGKAGIEDNGVAFNITRNIYNVKVNLLILANAFILKHSSSLVLSLIITTSACIHIADVIRYCHRGSIVAFYTLLASELSCEQCVSCSVQAMTSIA